ncbi:sugar ABC transporter permease, partial [Pseudomonas fluorescens]
MSADLTAKPRFVFLRSVFALMIREMATTYGRSPGGYIWAFAEPVGGTAMLTLVFAMVAHTPPLGDNFPLYFAAGILPFMMYQSTSAKIGAAIRYSKPLLAYPSVTYIDAIVARLLLTMLTEITIAIIMFGGIVLIYGLQLNIDFLTCVRAVAM